MRKTFLKIAAAAFAVLLSAPAFAQAMPFETWLQGVADEAVASGVSPQTVQRALAGVTLDEQVVELDQKQPESTITFDAYLHNVLTPARIEKGRELMAEHRGLLRDIQARTGVPPAIVIALWGMESSFGRNGGDFSVIDSLATLAYEGRRASFFRGELLEALHLLDEEHMDPSLLRGSWAGAMGQSQFMPSTFRRHAVDFDGDGRRDIWDTEADVLASIANYLAAEGWKNGQRWGREVRVSRVPAEQRAGLVQPDGPGGRSFQVYDNFRALMRWNRSTYFATSVGLMADRISSTK